MRRKERNRKRERENQTRERKKSHCEIIEKKRIVCICLRKNIFILCFPPHWQSAACDGRHGPRDTLATFPPSPPGQYPPNENGNKPTSAPSPRTSFCHFVLHWRLDGGDKSASLLRAPGGIRLQKSSFSISHMLSCERIPLLFILLEWRIILAFFCIFVEFYVFSQFFRLELIYLLHLKIFLF